MGASIENGLPTGYSGGPRFGRRFGASPGGAGPARDLRYRGENVQPGAFRLRFNTQQILRDLAGQLAPVLEATAREGVAYWNDVEWTVERHPEMTGEMRDALRLRLHPVGKKLVIELWLPASITYADFEERGTIFRDGHHPLRNTQQVLSKALKDRLRALGR